MTSIRVDRRTGRDRSGDRRVLSQTCTVCGEAMQLSREILWCCCGKLMSNNHSVYVDVP